MIHPEIHSTAPKIIMFEDGKLCSKCNEIKPLVDFYLNGSRVRSQCKKCQNDDNKARAKKTKPWLKKSEEQRMKDREYQRAYRKDNVEKRRKWQKEWLERNPDYHHERYLQRKNAGK